MYIKLSVSKAKSKKFVYNHETYGQILTLIDEQSSL